MNEEFQKKWVGGICIKDGKVLLIHRINKERLFNKEYFIARGSHQYIILEYLFPEFAIHIKYSDLTL